MEINFDSESLQITTSPIVKLNEYVTLLTEKGPIDLKVDIIADFKDVPEEYHEVMVNILTSKYINKVSFGHNPFSKCNPPKKRKWFNFFNKQ